MAATFPASSQAPLPLGSNLNVKFEASIIQDWLTIVKQGHKNLRLCEQEEKLIIETMLPCESELPKECSVSACKISLSGDKIEVEEVFRNYRAAKEM